MCSNRKFRMRDFGVKLNIPRKEEEPAVEKVGAHEKIGAQEYWNCVNDLFNIPHEPVPEDIKTWWENE